MYRDQGKYEEAEALFNRALTIRQQELGTSHPESRGPSSTWLSSMKVAVKAGVRLPIRGRQPLPSLPTELPKSTGAQTGAAGGLVEQRAIYFQRHVANLTAAANKGIEPASSLAHEALQVAQWAGQSSAAAALQQMSSRFVLEGGALGSLVRERQDLSAAWHDKDKALLDALSDPEGQQIRVVTKALRKQIAEIEHRLTAIAARLDNEFPDYAALAHPKPLTAEEVQNLLGADEALVFFLVGPTRATFLRLRARVSNGGRFRSARRTWRRRSPTSAAALMSMS